MEEQPVMLPEYDPEIYFTLEMPKNNQLMSSLNALPVSEEVNETREVESTMSNQEMDLGERIRHISSFSINFDVDFFVADIKRDFTHKWVNHKVNFVDPNDRRVHTQSIEATWGALFLKPIIMRRKIN